MMNRLVNIAGRTLRYSYTIESRRNIRLKAVYAAVRNLNITYSTKASELKNVLPKFWITKMKSAFSWIDSDGNGYVTENDFVAYEKEMKRLLPDASKEQRDHLVSHRKTVWDDFYGGKGKGPDYKLTEDIYIKRCYHFTTQEGGEYSVRREWENLFAALDINNDGVISKSEHQIFFQSCKDPIGAIVSFTAIDQDMDGMISRDEFSKAGTEFFFNFTDETKPSKYIFGPLRY